MASEFPTALPQAKTDYDSNDLVASADINALAEDINAIGAKVGIDSSADTNSHDYKIDNVVVPVKATGAEINTGTNDAKFATPKAITDSNVAFVADIPVKATGAESNVGTNDAKFLTPLAYDTARTTVTTYTPAGAGTTTLDLSLGNIFRVTMPATTQTLAISNETTGQEFVVEIVNVTGQGALTWFSTITWARGGAAPALSDSNGVVDTFRFRVTGTDTYIGYDDDTYVKEDATQTLTNKSIDGDDNTLTDIPAAELKIASEAQGDILYRGASDWARLAKGTADQALRMNSGATAPEWGTATQSKLITGTRDITAATGDVAYTGVGFTPTSIMFIAWVNATNDWGMGLAGEGITQGGITGSYLGTGGDIAGSNDATTQCFTVHTGASPDGQQAKVKSYDSDGFTLTWTKEGTPGAATIWFMALCMG